MFSHLDHENCFPNMVDISQKNNTYREACARTRVELPLEIITALKNGELHSPKGPVFSTAIVAGTLAAKKTATLIPFCHSLNITDCKIEIKQEEERRYAIYCTVKTNGATGVEMEALTGSSVAALTVYDMCKSFSQKIKISSTELIYKRGGKSDFKKLEAPPIYGLILAGGKSSRMGQDKALLSYHENKNQMIVCYDLLQKFGARTFLSQRMGQYENTPIEKIDDIYPELGPISGILSAMRTFPEAAWLVLAVDLPRLSIGVLENLLKQRDLKHDATAYQSTFGDFLEPLCTVYEPKSYIKILEHVAMGVKCPTKILKNISCKKIVSLNENDLMNVNTKAEYELMREGYV